MTKLRRSASREVGNAGTQGPKDVSARRAKGGTVANNIAATLNTPIGASKEKLSTMIIRKNDVFAKKD